MSAVLQAAPLDPGCSECAFCPVPWDLETAQGSSVQGLCRVDGLMACSGASLLGFLASLPFSLWGTVGK